METKNYSLEKHLEAICDDDKDYAVLLAVWRLNKENLAAALKNVASMFPHYSQHDISHSIKILDNIQRLLGRERVERLGATDTFLLLMSALTHDLGMYMTYEMVEKEWDKPEMKKLIESYADSSDKQIASAARLLQGRAIRPVKPAEGYRWALEIRNAVTIILAHQMRGKHGDRSAEHLEKSDFFWKYSRGFHFDALPDRYLTLIAQVAHLHGSCFDEVLKLPQTADGFKSDYIHPRFIASMIRMGDLLDIDNNRFNLYSMATVKEVPESSQAHFDKHQALKHLLISPEGIEATMDCPTEASFRVAREVFDWLESEVEKLCREWSVITPQDLGGLPPVLHKDKINIFYKGTKTRPELRNLRFEISSQRTFEMLKGGAIYKNPGLVFLREIVQNAMDATKLQIWKDMDVLLPFDFEKPERHFKTRQELKEKAFSNDVPTSVYQKYPIRLMVEYDKNTRAVIVTCEDRGTGISEESLIRMTSQVGASRIVDKNYEKTIEEMPYFLQPTAAFGLGLQTVFYVADEFTVDTHYPGEPSRRIVFRTSTNGSYCSIEKEDLKDWVVAHGTKITIVVNSEHLSSLFELDKEESQELIKYPDAAYNFLSKIDRYAQGCFESIEDIAFEYQSRNLSFRTEQKYKYDYIGGEGNYRLFGRRGSVDGDDSYLAYLIEDRELGGRLSAFFRSGIIWNYELINEDLFFRGGDILLRSIPVTSVDGWWESFVGIELNFCSRRADRLVTISRTGLLPQGDDWCREKIEGLLPTIVRLIHDHLKKQCSQHHTKEIKNVLLLQYRSLCLLNWNLLKPIKVDLKPLDSDEVENSVDDFERNRYYDKQRKAVRVNDVFDSKEIIAIDGFRINENRRAVLAETNKINTSEAIFTDSESIIPDTYVCSEVFFVKNKKREYFRCYRLVRGHSSGVQWVTVSDIRKYRRYTSQNLSHGFSNYKAIVVEKNAPLLGNTRPYHSNCWIYPYYQKALTSIPNTRVQAEKFLQEKGRMEKVVPEYIVSLILKYNALGNNYSENEIDIKRIKEDIYNTYIRFILDRMFGEESTQ